jgi:signal transduction histidine kinase
MFGMALAATLSAAPANFEGGDALVLTGPASIEAINPHLDYAIDPDWRLTAKDFAGRSAVEMKPLPGPRPDFGYTTAKIWLRLHVINGAPGQKDWRLSMPVSFLQQLAIYLIAPDGRTTTLLDLHEASPFGARPIDYPQVVVPFTLEPDETASLLVSYYSLGAARHTLAVETPDSFAAKAAVNTAKNYAFYGMMLVMIALAIVALATLRQIVFAAYAAYAASIFLYIAHVDGMAFQHIWPTFPQFNSMAAALTGSGVMVFSGLLAMSFLHTAYYNPIMHRVLLVVVASVLVLDLVLWTTDPKLLNRLLVYVILVCVLSYVIAGLVAARTRFREVRFYLLAWSASLIPAILFTARLAFGIEPSFITIYDAIRIALAVDALMMGLAIFDRYNHLRQSAMEETLAHAQRNLALSQRLASLEESYQQVSANARQREESVKDTIHDLRQPMHALRLSLRQMFNAGAEKATDVGQLESALGYMERLVAERLSDQPALKGAKAAVGKQDGPTFANGSHKPTKEPARSEDSGEPGLHGVLRGITDMFASEATQKGLGLKLVLAAPDGKVAAYPLMRVTANLVSNAIKYTHTGRILIALRRHGLGYRVEVHDTGPGLNGPAFEQALIRDRRLARDLVAAEGSGLGLSVVKEIVEANNWRLTSRAGRRTGASILIELPCQ